MMNDPGVIAIIGLCVLLVAWYGGASLYNRRLGQRLFDWLEAGLGVLGGEREAGWLAGGSPASGARVNVWHAAPPFRRLEFTLLLESREVLPIWLLAHLRGKRDGLIIKATLRSPRRGEVEILPGRVAQTLRTDDPSWEWRAAPHDLKAATRGPGASRQFQALSPWLETVGAHLQRLSWRKTDPHLQLQFNASTLSVVPIRTVLADLSTALHPDNPEE